ncbi:MAG: sugar ABC transporter permease [Spirochaetales bacterium]
MHTTRRGHIPWLALAYMAPALVLFTVFSFLPFARAIQLSLFLVDRNTFEPAKWFGLGYYQRILNVGDTALGDEWLRSIVTTFQFTLMVVPLTLILALGLALLASAKVKGIGVYRTIFTSSLAISLASAGVIWSLFYSPSLKLFDHVLTDAATALPAVAAMTIWTSLGFAFIILLAGLKAIPKDLWESARIDGANAWTTFWRVTLPLLTPTLLFLLITSTIGAFQAFTQFKVLIDSVGPDGSTNVLVFALFTAFWTENNYGFAAALSVVLFALLLVLSLAQYCFDGRVHYQ